MAKRMGSVLLASPTKLPLPAAQFQWLYKMRKLQRKGALMKFSQCGKLFKRELFFCVCLAVCSSALLFYNQNRNYRFSSQSFDRLFAFKSVNLSILIHKDDSIKPHLLILSNQISAKISQQYANRKHFTKIELLYVIRIYSHFPTNQNGFCLLLLHFVKVQKSFATKWASI